VNLREFLFRDPIVAALAALAEHAYFEFVVTRDMGTTTVYYRFYLVVGYKGALKLRRGTNCCILLFTYALLSLPNRSISVFIILLSPRPSSSLVLAKPLQLTWWLMIGAEKTAVLLLGSLRILHLIDISETRVVRSTTVVIECLLLIIYLHHFFINLIIIHNY
jgi:hypothetical protein